MKIGILTQPLIANYGGLLQNYALQQVLIHTGHEVETIDWESPKNFRAFLYKAIMKIMSVIFPNKYKKPRYELNSSEKLIIYREPSHFISTYIRHTKKVHSKAEFKKQAVNGQYDAFIVGSDQCWRPCYNSFLTSMFLDFTQGLDVKRLAYAASFGTGNWEFSQKSTKICSTLAQKFDLITVREDSGVTLCRNYLSVNAIHVLDPTMLLTKDDYINLVIAEKEPRAAGTLFNYILDPDEKKTAFIDKLAKEKGLQSFQVLPKFQAENRTRKDVKEHIEDCVFPGITAWLRAFMDAEMIIVDSFHGAVFSIIFNKSFWVIGNTDRGLSRFTSLLKLFHLEERLLNIEYLEEVDFLKPINWENVNRILRKEQDKSKSILLNELDK